MSMLPFVMGGSPMGDAGNYIAIAENIVAGRGIVIDDPSLTPNLRAFYPPLYPAILGLVGIAAPLKAPTLVVLNFLIDIGAAAAILWLAQLCRSRSGDIAAAAWMLWPSTFLAAPLAQKEGLVVLLVVLIAALMLHAAQSRRRFSAILLGGCIGLLALTQPSLLLLPGIFALILFRDFRSVRDWCMTMVIAVTAAGLVLAPWWIRNYLLFDRFVPLTTASGMTLWFGIQPGGEWVLAPRRLLGPELEMSRLAGAEAWAWIIANPGQFIADSLHKGVRMLLLNIAIPFELFHMKTTRPVPVELLAFLTGATHFGLIAGTIASARNGSGLSCRLLGACLVYFFLFQIWFVGVERLRIHMTPFALIMAAAWIGSTITAKRSRGDYPLDCVR